MIQRIYNNEEYYQRRAYTLEHKYPCLELIAKILTKNYSPEKVLDIGCAKGFLVYALRKLGVEAYGIDISEYAVSHSPRAVRNYLKVVNAEKEELPFGDSTLDMITSMECMEHLQNPNHTVVQMTRTLKEGGIAAICVPKLHPIVSIRIYKDAVLHPNILSKSSWIKMFKANSFLYLGDFIRQEPKEVQDDFRERRGEHAYYTTPNLAIARYLKRLGRLGKWARVKLSLLLYVDEYLLFRKETKCN